MSDLLKINVNDHTEKKNGLTYLSWAWAWAEVLKIDPDAEWEPVEYWMRNPGDEHDVSIPSIYLPLPDGTAMVKVKVTIKGKTKLAVLPVMNPKNQPIQNPNAFQVNTAIQRCLAKAIAMHGLGLYIYAGEDLPEVDDAEIAKQKKRLSELDDLALTLIDLHKEGRDTDAIRIWYAPDTFPPPTDEDGAEERAYVWSQLRKESALRSAIKANKPAPGAEPMKEAA